MHDYRELFGAEGPLAAAIPGFATREEQIAMAEQVALALRSHGRLIVEAGTGTGKTFAYLVPARMLEQGQVVYYTLRITNQTTVPLRNVAVVQPVPANTTYLADSASGPGADVSFSVDGRTFAPAASLMIDSEGTKQLAQATQYTHIRWQLRKPLAPGAIALARFRATFR